MKPQDFDDLIVDHCGDPLNRRVLVGPSFGRETRYRVSKSTLADLVERNEGQITWNGKTPTEGLDIYEARKGRGRQTVRRARVILPNRQEEDIELGSQPEYDGVVAGSGANVASALAFLARTSDIGLVGALGSGSSGRMIATSLGGLGFQYRLMFRRPPLSGTNYGETTPHSLWLQDGDGGTISFSYKRPYLVPSGVLEYLRERTTAPVFVGTGFMPCEIDMIDAIMTAQQTPKVRVLSPHEACFRDEIARRRCLEIASRATLVHVNGTEMALWLEVANPEWHQENDTEVGAILHRIGAEIVCVTLSERGSVTYDRLSGKIIRQSAFPTTAVINPVAAGDVHLSFLLYLEELRGRPLSLAASLEVASWGTSQKMQAQSDDGSPLRPTEGIPESRTRKPIVHAAEARHAKALG